MISNVSETGYSYFGARYYDSDISVWLSVDPLAGKYPSMSPFMYTAGNPVMLVDPDGRAIKFLGISENTFINYLSSIGCNDGSIFKLKDGWDDNGNRYYFSKSNMSKRRFSRRAKRRFHLSSEQTQEAWDVYTKIKSKDITEVQIISPSDELLFSDNELWGSLETKNKALSKGLASDPINNPLMEDFQQTLTGAKLQNTESNQSTTKKLGLYYKNESNNSGSYNARKRKTHSGKISGIIVVTGREKDKALISEELYINIGEIFRLTNIQHHEK